jgi:trk system potassium uptake protein TrkH
VTALARLRRAVQPASLGVEIGAALNLVGALLKGLSLTTLLPAAVALGYGEPPWPFLAAGAIAAGAGWSLEAVTQGKERVGAREGFLVVSLIWLLAAVFGALPYLFWGGSQLDRPIDALFESMSGFTTTGASVVTDLTELSRSVALWRQFTQWLGGMGIIVLALAILPRLRVGGRQLMESELPGPEMESLTTRIRDTARRLWLIYLTLTAAEIVLLSAYGWAGADERMTPYQAVAHAFTTMPTGGFSPEARSVEAFAAVSQWTIALFMVLAGANFALMYRAVVRRALRVAARDGEFRLYLGLLLLGSVVLLADLLGRGVYEGEAAVRHAVFQAVSIMTTTGYASADFAQWPVLAAVVLLALMFAGGSAASTAGSIKIVRHLLVGKLLHRELDQTVHPEIVVPLRIAGTVVDERTVRAVIAFVLLYVGLFAAGTIAIVIDSERASVPVTALDAAFAAATTLGNVGPGYGFAGPMGSFEPFTDVSAGTMIALMWLGRLEVIPIIVLFTRRYWRA